MPRFVRKHKVNFLLLADAEHEVAEKYGKSFMGLARTTVLIGPDGVVVHRRGNVKVDGHAEAVPAAAELL